MHQAFSEVFTQMLWLLTFDNLSNYRLVVSLLESNAACG